MNTNHPIVTLYAEQYAARLYRRDVRLVDDSFKRLVLEVIHVFFNPIPRDLHGDRVVDRIAATLVLALHLAKKALTLPAAISRNDARFVARLLVNIYDLLEREYDHLVADPSYRPICGDVARLTLAISRNFGFEIVPARRLAEEIIDLVEAA